MLLTREAFFATTVAPQTEDVPWPEAGTSIRVRGLSGLERDRFEQAIFDNQQRRERARKKAGAKPVPAIPFRLALVVRAIVDEDGQRLFKDDEYTQVGERLPAEVTERVFDTARRLSGMSDKDAEELEGNSDETDGDDSPSD